MNVLVTGSRGFIGKHIVSALARRNDTVLNEFHRASPRAEFESAIGQADVIIHAAGVNRPEHESEFDSGNVGLTANLCAELNRQHRRPLIVFTSSTQAALENAYGNSKRKAEQILRIWAKESGGSAVVLRVRNVFGKWCRPNYNSVIATFCHNIAHGLPIQISDPNKVLELVYIDDLVAGLLNLIDSEPVSGRFVMRDIPQFYKATLGEIAAIIQGFKASRQSLELPSLSDGLVHRLYAMYLSYLDPLNFGYSLDQKKDDRGSLAEFMKSPHSGQIFLSRTRPGITRGNHFHHTKTEKFMVVEGEAIIRFRQIHGTEIIEYRVNGRDFRVLDIPPGYTHSIENTGNSEMVTLFWASEIFDPNRPDTIALPVL